MNPKEILEMIEADITYGTIHQRAKDVKIWSDEFKHGYDAGYYDCLKTLKKKILDL